VALYKKGKAIFFEKKWQNFLDEALDHSLFWHVFRKELKYCGTHTVLLALA